MAVIAPWKYSVGCAFCPEQFAGTDATLVAAACWNHECVRCKAAPKHHMPDLETINKRMTTTRNEAPRAESGLI